MMTSILIEKRTEELYGIEIGKFHERQSAKPKKQRTYLSQAYINKLRYNARQQAEREHESYMNNLANKVCSLMLGNRKALC